MRPGEDDVQPLWGAGDKGAGRKGENMPPISRGKETVSMCVRNVFFLWEPAKGCSGSTKQGFELERPTTGANRTICLFVAGEQGGMGTKGNVNALLLLGELAAGDAHPTASKYYEQHRDVSLFHANWQSLERNQEISI